MDSAVGCSSLRRQTPGAEPALITGGSSCPWEAHAKRLEPATTAARNEAPTRTPNRRRIVVIARQCRERRAPYVTWSEQISSGLVGVALALRPIRMRRPSGALKRWRDGRWRCTQRPSRVGGSRPPLAQNLQDDSRPSRLTIYRRSFSPGRCRRRVVSLRDLSGWRIWQTSFVQLIAAEGLRVDVAVDGTVKIGLNGEDWFGPGRPSLPPDVGEPVTGDRPAGCCQVGHRRRR